MDLGVIQFACLAMALFIILLSLSSAVAWRGIRRRTTGLAPATRAGVLTGVAFAPLVGAILLTFAAFGPKLLVPFGFDDHCASHSGHDHLCMVHAASPKGLFAWAGVVLMAGLAVVFSAMHIPVALRVRRARAVLDALGDSSPAGRCRIVPSDQPFAATIGYLRPDVFMSSALVNVLEPEDAAIVRAHEDAHRSRRDPLRLALARVMSLVHFPGVRRQVLSDLALSCEQAADEVAALGVGDRLRVASVLLAVERIMGDTLIPGNSISGGALSARVESLSNDPGTMLTRRMACFLALVVLVCLGLVSGILHHTVETILSFLTR
jgi:Zn-dependent protease with chaperone function